MAAGPEIVSAIVGLGVGAGLAALKYTLDQRARMHEDLWSRRLDPYREIWALTSLFSRWPRREPTRSHLVDLQERLRRWYYGDGGILMSVRSRRRYEYVQRGLGAIAARSADPDRPVDTEDYDDMVEICSRLRSALTGDLESRRKRSVVWSLVDLREDRRVRRELKGRLDRLSR